MKTRKIPMRTCVISHERLEKKELFRVVRTPDGNIIIDETLKANGRGAYLKKDKSVIEKARQSKVLDKHLEVNVPDEIYSELINQLDKE